MKKLFNEPFIRLIVYNSDVLRLSGEETSWDDNVDPYAWD